MSESKTSGSDNFRDLNCPRCGDLFYHPKTMIEDMKQHAAEWEEIAKRAEIECDQRSQRVKELEAQLDEARNHELVTAVLAKDMEIRQAADDMARALESADKTLKYAQEEYAHGHGVNLIYETIQTNGRALDRYRKLFPKGRE